MGFYCRVSFSIALRAIGEMSSMMTKLLKLTPTALFFWMRPRGPVAYRKKAVEAPVPSWSAPSPG